MPSGLTHNCMKRFALGINYAWHNFAGDFGGISAWNQRGVSGDASTYSNEMAQMAENGVSVIRWWMFPDFRGDGVVFDGAGDASGLSATAEADIEKALELADQHGLHLVLTLFSFDNFRPTRTDSGITIRGITPMVTDATRRTALIDNVVRRAARVAAQSPYAHRLLGWDVINEPEWAIEPGGNAPNGGEFTPNDELDSVPLATMVTFINEASRALRQETPDASVSVGWAAAKWAWAFEDVDIDFHQPHIYGWVNDYWPYTTPAAELGYSNKPIVMGEFHLGQMPFDTQDTFQQILDSWWANGYAGAWPWQYIEQQSNLSLIRAFAEDKGCSAGFP
jgi:hypothetical protein